MASCVPGSQQWINALELLCIRPNAFPQVRLLSAPFRMCPSVFAHILTAGQ